MEDLTRVFISPHSLTPSHTNLQGIAPAQVYYLHSTHTMYQARRKRGGAGGVLAKQLTLSQPGGQIMPTTVVQAPPDFQTLRRPCVSKYLAALGHYFIVLRDWPIVLFKCLPIHSFEN